MSLSGVVIGRLRPRLCENYLAFIDIGMPLTNNLVYRLIRSRNPTYLSEKPLDGLDFPLSVSGFGLSHSLGHKRNKDRLEIDLLQLFLGTAISGADTLPSRVGMEIAERGIEDQ